MNEQHPDGRETLNEKNLWQCSGWLLVASLVVTAVLLATNHRYWTNIAPWIPQAFVAGFGAYAWSFLRWMRWGERRRASGDGSLFGSHSRVGATAASHSLLFQVVVGGAICVLGGYATSHLHQGMVGVILFPCLVIGVPEEFEHGDISVIYRSAALFAFPLLVGCGVLLGLSDFTLTGNLIGLAPFLLGASVLTWMVRAHAREPWPSKEETEWRGL